MPSSINGLVHYGSELHFSCRIPRIHDSVARM